MAGGEKGNEMYEAGRGRRKKKKAGEIPILKENGPNSIAG